MNQEWRLSARKQWEHRMVKEVAGEKKCEGQTDPGMSKAIVNSYHIEGQIDNFTILFSFYFLNSAAKETPLSR